MIRFIDLGHQIYSDDESPRAFAFYCTVKCEFETFSGMSIWESREDFKDDFDDEDQDVQRYLELIPDSWNKSWRDIVISIGGKEIKAITSINYQEIKCLADTESELIEALQNEDYERASILRDQIKELKNK